MKNTALLIIDIQNDYFPGGNMELAGAKAAGEKAGEVLAFFRDRNLPVFHIQHESVKEGATFFLSGTRGQKIHDSVTPGAGERVIQKNFPNSFLGTGLLNDLKAEGIENLVITGMMTFMCVDATARAAKDLGFTCTLVHDTTAARDLTFEEKTIPADQVKTAFLAALTMICDQVISSEMFFKQID